MWNINLFATYRDNSLKILLAYFIGPLHIFNTRRPSLPLLGISPLKFFLRVFNDVLYRLLVLIIILPLLARSVSAILKYKLFMPLTIARNMIRFVVYRYTEGS